MTTEIIVAVIGAIALITSGIITYFKDLRIKKIEIENKQMKSLIESAEQSVEDANIKINILNKLGNFFVFNEIRSSIDRIFENIKADRFLILIALNGKKDFRTMSVVFEQHKHPELKINAIVRYRDILIDVPYKILLKNVENWGEVNLNIDTMPNQLLKDFYTIEQVQHSKLIFLHRKHLDSDNDMVVYCSAATHLPEKFNNIESTIIKTEIDSSIRRTIIEYI